VRKMPARLPYGCAGAEELIALASTAQDHQVDMAHWSDSAIELIAHRFKLLSEPTRLRLLFVLFEGEKTVSELVEITGLTQANVSQQLSLLANGGLIVRHKTQQRVWCRLADPNLKDLCELVCKSLCQCGTKMLSSLTEEKIIL